MPWGGIQHEGIRAWLVVRIGITASPPVVLSAEIKSTPSSGLTCLSGYRFVDVMAASGDSFDDARRAIVEEIDRDDFWNAWIRGILGPGER